MKRWIFRITIITLIISMILSVVSELLLRNLNIYVAILIFLTIIFLGIFFDIIGISFALVKKEPFNAMASKKVYGSKKAVELIKNASIVSNFCNDVVGDISGIISGAAAVIIVIKLSQYDFRWQNISFLNVLLSAFTASVTVGGKAYGKYIASKNNKEIVYKFSKVIYILEEKFKIKLF